VPEDAKAPLRRAEQRLGEALLELRIAGEGLGDGRGEEATLLGEEVLDVLTRVHGLAVDPLGPPKP
jgi:hypothetical protein